jgi:hypothetical protein
MKMAYEPSRTNLNFHPQVALARGVILVDEDLSALIPLLEDLGFRVFSLMPGRDDNRLSHSSMDDLEIAHLLPGPRSGDNSMKTTIAPAHEERSRND